MTREKSFRTFIRTLGARTMEPIVFIGRVASVLPQLRNPRRLRLRETLYYLDLCGVKSLPIVLAICFLMGVVMAVNGQIQLSKVGQEIFVVDLVGFAVLSFKENGWAGIVSQGLGTSMLQIPNIMRRPQLLIPPTIASMICGPIATGAFKLMCGASGGGMGTCGFVGIIEAYNASIIQGGMEQWKFWLAIAFLFFIMPAVICWAIGKLMRHKGWIKEGDLKI